MAARDAPPRTRQLNPRFAAVAPFLCRCLLSAFGFFNSGRALRCVSGADATLLRCVARHSHVRKRERCTARRSSVSTSLLDFGF
eukprot:EW704102.1.p3 GENE.EW704102.1~~EW704102.1.p3  ORF type:complete len:84 (+),score=14.80 EW704102.1:1-252(+)